MKRVIFSSLLFLITLSLWGQSNPVEHIIYTLNHPKDKYITVVSHRGDWRNFPENSLKGIESAINIGVDIVEIDLAMTSDSVLVLMHDRTVDRTTNGKGKVSSYTLDSLKKLRLKNGCGVVSKYPVPTFEEVLELCKGRVMLNIDKGFDYFPLVQKLLEKTGTARQILIKSGYDVAKVEKAFANISDKNMMMYMPIINIQKEGGEDLLNSYLAKMPAVAYEVVFSKLNSDVTSAYSKIINSNSRVWVNTLWDSLCGGMDDDDAVDDLSVYDIHIKMGATIFQTDRPEMLIKYLRDKGLHR
ncbi:MAG: glycerophosphodiester phosphodiesterase family protein [Flavobacteriales bacterium]|nr:glycerophosphodiester phosphodiesterase family protein [Flavobacteriales bacterium]